MADKDIQQSLDAFERMCINGASGSHDGISGGSYDSATGTSATGTTYEIDTDYASPTIWRHEFVIVLSSVEMMRQHKFKIIAADAEQMIQYREYTLCIASRASVYTPFVYAVFECRCSRALLTTIHQELIGCITDDGFIVMHHELLFQYLTHAVTVNIFGPTVGEVTVIDEIDEYVDNFVDKTNKPYE